MATKIVTKNSSTASAVPTASDLVQGELAVNVADKRLFTEDNGGSIVELGTNPSTIDINAGSIDGTAIGASSASTGAFTTLTATGLTVNNTTAFSYLPVSTAGSVVGTIGTGSGTIFNTPSVNASYGSGLAIDGSYSSDVSTINLKAFGPKFSSYSSQLVFHTSSGTSLTERMRIDGSGNVGIGTSSPVARLEVHGAFPFSGTVTSLSTSVSKACARIRGSSDASTSLYFGSIGNDAEQYIQASNSAGTGADDIALNPYGGNVGIGTASPTEKLEIQEGNVAIRSSTISQETPFYFMRDDSGQTADYVASIGMQAASSSDWRGVITFNAKSGSAYNNTTIAERMRIDSSGNLLVGTTVSPDSGDPTSVRYGIGVQAGSLSSTTTCTAGVITNVLDMANAVSGVNGAGLWLISVVRGGASYATHFTGVFGVNSSSMVLYQTIQSSGMTVSVNGLNLRINVSTTDGYRVNAIPLSINT